jgi:iron complex outermembrane receptor protein
MKNQITNTLLSVAVSSVVGASSALAQIEEIIVTAQKRAESVQDIGVAVSAMSGDDMRANNLVEPRDLFTKMPNVALQTNNSAGQLQLGIRGVSFATFSPIGVQPVMVFQDEVVLNSPAVAGLFIFDAERVEVLRGPQNTLYGRNTTGGAVNFISSKPEIGGGTKGYVDLSAGNYDTLDLNAAIGGELGNNAAYRVAIQSLNNDGYWKNQNDGLDGDRLGERNQNLFRAQIAWEPTDDTRWLFNLHGGKSEGGSRPLKAHGVCPGNMDIDNFNNGCVNAEWDGLTPNSETDEAYSELKNDIDDITAFGGSIRFDKDYEGFTFMSLTAWEENEYDHWEDADALNDISFVLFRQKSETEQFTQEFRWTSDDSADIRWIGGAFAMIETAELYTTVPILVDIPEVAFAANSNLKQDTDMFSVFGQMETDLTDRLSLTAGLRYVYEKKEGDVRAQMSAGLSVLDINQPDAWLYPNLVSFRDGDEALIPFEETWHQWGGKIGLEFAADEDKLWYGSISRGEKGGQFTDAPEAVLLGIAGDPADPEEVVAYEVGFKATWAEKTLQTNLALFYNDYTNQQLQITVVAPNGGLASTVVNAAESETYGLEFDALYAPGGGWTFDFALGLLKTEVVKESATALTGGATPIEEGRNLTNAPEFTANIGVTKEFELDNGSLITANLNARYTDEREFNLVDTPETREYTTDPSYILVNAFVEYRFGGEQQYKLSAWGKNLTDELYFNHMQEFSTVIGFPGNPRQYGVTFGVDF